MSVGHNRGRRYHKWIWRGDTVSRACARCGMSQPRPGQRVPRCDGPRHPIASQNLVKELVQILDWYMDQYSCPMPGLACKEDDLCMSCSQDYEFRLQAEKLASEVGLNHEDPDETS